MLDYLHKAKEYLWTFVELGFLAILTVMLIYLIMGQDSGVFVSGVADNVMKFAAAIPAQSLVGIAIVLALIFLLSRRVRERD
jgi:nitrate reductase gamma subunit